MPSDTVELWEAVTQLPGERRTQFLEVANLWQASLAIAQDHPTTSLSLMVAACEALKPRTSACRDCNVYDVLESLLGPDELPSLQDALDVQDVRNDHLHAAILHGTEFDSRLKGFWDPSFDQAHQLLSRTVPAAIVEWLARGGECAPIQKR